MLNVIEICIALLMFYNNDDDDILQHFKSGVFCKNTRWDARYQIWIEVSVLFSKRVKEDIMEVYRALVEQVERDVLMEVDVISTDEHDIVIQFITSWYSSYSDVM